MSVIDGLEQIARRDEPLAPYTWFRIGGAADYFAEPTNLDELSTLVARCREQDVPVRILGGGSNILVRDEGVAGLVVRLQGEAFQKISIQADRAVAAGGAKLGHVISSAVREGLGGLETLVGIPGTIGGALHGNAGGRGGDVGQWVARAQVMTLHGDIIDRMGEDLVFSYRESSLDELVILEAEFKLEAADPEELTKRMQKQWIVKKASQPLAHQSAGCIFKNPRGMSAGMLIEQAGLKGLTVGKCQVSERHANFILAEEGATSADCIRLIEQIRGTVEQRLGVELVNEIQIW